MSTSVVKSIEMDARQKFIDYITTTANTLYYIQNGKDLTAGVIAIEDLGFTRGELLIPSRNPEDFDDVVVWITIVEIHNRLEVSAFSVLSDFVDEYDIPCGALYLGQLYSLASQFESKFNRVKNK